MWRWIGVWHLPDAPAYDKVWEEVAVLRGSPRCWHAQQRVCVRQDRGDASPPGAASCAAAHACAPSSALSEQEGCRLTRMIPSVLWFADRSALHSCRLVASRSRSGTGAPPRSRCLLSSARSEKEGCRPTRMMTEALRCCHRGPPAACRLKAAGGKVPPRADHGYLGSCRSRRDSRSTLHSQGSPCEPGQGANVREGWSRRGRRHKSFQELVLYSIIPE